MSNWITDTYKRIRTGWYKFVGIRIAKDVTEDERNTCDRYGEQVIATMLAGGFTPKPEDLAKLYQTDETRDRTRDWLTERADIREWRERWVSGRDLLLEIVVIVLIGWELVVARRQDTNQASNFTKQQEVLQHLADSSRDTASTLGSLKDITDKMNGNIVILQGPVERNAAAAEATSATATRSMHASERAYITCDYSPSLPKADEKWNVTVTMTNSGSTVAVELISVSGVALAPKGTSEEDVRKQIFSGALKSPPSSTILGGGQHAVQNVEVFAALSNMAVDAINDGRTVAYVFTDLTYKDIFDRQHRNQQCGYYIPSTKAIAGCAKLNKAD